MKEAYYNQKGPEWSPIFLLNAIGMYDNIFFIFFTPTSIYTTYFLLITPRKKKPKYIVKPIDKFIIFNKLDGINLISF